MHVTAWVECQHAVQEEWHSPRTDADEVVSVLLWQELALPVSPVTGAAHTCTIVQGQCRGISDMIDAAQEAAPCSSTT